MSSSFKPSFDNRFSMADSEWSVDDTDASCHYVKDPVGQSSSSPHPLYDLPPEVSKKVQLASVEEKEEEKAFVHVNPIKKETKMKENSPEMKTNPNVKCWVKVYIALLTIAVLALAGVLTFTMLRPQNGSGKPIQTSPRGRIVSTSLVEQLEMRVENLEKSLRRLFKAYPISNEPKEDLQENGCLVDDVKMGSTCYHTKKVDTLIQYKALYECSILANGQLAMLNSLQVENQLSLYLQTDLDWWIDGYREGETKDFKLTDDTELSQNFKGNLTGESGDCLSATVVDDKLQLSIKNCYDYLDGYICQYPANEL